MKKLILAVTLVSASTLTHAGTYIQANAGFSSFEFDTGHDNNISDDTVSYGIAIGNAMENGARVAVDYHSLARDKVNFGENSYAKAKIESVGLSAIYDFKNGTPLTPYIGVKVSANRLGFDGENFGITDGVSRVDFEYAHYRNTQVGLGAVAGVQYQLSQNVALDGAVEYNYLGKFDGIKLTQYGAKAGVRYDF